MILEQLSEDGLSKVCYSMDYHRGNGLSTLEIHLNWTENRPTKRHKFKMVKESTKPTPEQKSEALKLFIETLKVK